MGYARSLLQSDVRAEETALRKKGKKKSLWGSIGRTLGGLGATLLTGGAAAPWAVGLAAGAGTFAGGALGSQWAGKIGKGKFFQGDRKSLEKQLDPFGEANIVGGLKAAVTAGIGQKLKLMKSGETAAKGFDFGASTLGKGLAKGKAAKELSTMRGFQGQYESLQKAKATKELTTMRGWEGQYEALPDVKAGRIRAKYGDITGVGKGADVAIDQGLTGPMENIPFDRSSMLKRQASARFQGGQGVPTGVSGSGTDFTETSAWEKYTQPSTGYKPSYEFEHGTPESRGFGTYTPTWDRSFRK
jgi:hypothetical protein